MNLSEQADLCSKTFLAAKFSTGVPPDPSCQQIIKLNEPKPPAPMANIAKGKIQFNLYFKIYSNVMGLKEYDQQTI